MKAIRRESDGDGSAKEQCPRGLGMEGRVLVWRPENYICRRSYKEPLRNQMAMIFFYSGLLRLGAHGLQPM
jgi:hypothetical protein